MISLIFITLAQINPNLGRYDTPAGTYEPGTDVFSTGNTIERIISNGVGALTMIASIMFMIYFFIGALIWATAGSDEGKVETAKKQMTNGAIGLIIVVLAYGIISVLGNFVGLDILNPATLLPSLGPLPNNSGGGVGSGVGSGPGGFEQR